MLRYSLQVKPGLREKSRYFRGSRSSGGGGGRSGGSGSAENKNKIKRAKLQFRFSHTHGGSNLKRVEAGLGKERKKEASKLATSNRCLLQCENTGGRFTALLEEAHPCVFVLFFFFPTPSSFLRRSRSLSRTPVPRR